MVNLSSFYIACAENSQNSSSKCKELYNKGKLPPKGGLELISKTEALFSSKSVLFSLGFISTIKISKTGINGFETFVGTKKNYSLSIFYKRHNFPFEEDYIEDIQLKCGEIDYKLLEEGFLMNNNIEYGFQIYYKKTKFSENFKKISYYSNIYLEMLPETEENEKNKPFADFLLENPKWNKLQCVNNNEHVKIKLYFKQEFIGSEIWENPLIPDYFLTCSDNFDDLLKLKSNNEFSKEKNEIIAFCPQYCSKTSNNNVLGNNVYYGKSPICASAIDFGIINDFYSGFVKFSWYSMEKNQANFFMFEPLVGKISKNDVSDKNVKIVKKNNISNYFRSFLEISGKNKAELTNIPNEVLSKISETMNQNSKEIIKQNHNIEMLSKENSELNKKIEELENGEQGITNLTKIIANLENSLGDLKQNLETLMINQQNSHQIYQQKLKSFESKNSKIAKNLRSMSTFSEDFSNVLKIIFFFNFVKFYKFSKFFLIFPIFF